MQRFVAVRAPLAPINKEPRVVSVQVSQRPYGHVLDVLERQDDWYRVRSADGYEGWVHRGYLDALKYIRGPQEQAAGAASPAGDGALAALLELLHPLLRTSLGCAVRDARGTRRRLPLGALLLDPEMRVEAGEAIAHDALRRRFPCDPDAVPRTALEFFEGTSYVWGGVTPWGADCSGLVQTVFGLHGVPLPRDAWQQAECGGDAGGDFAALRSGDLLFFSDRADGGVTHVAIALGPMRAVHLAVGRGGYAVERLDDTSDPYVGKLRERFLFARRVI